MPRMTPLIPDNLLVLQINNTHLIPNSLHSISNDLCSGGRGTWKQKYKNLTIENNKSKRDENLTLTMKEL